MTFQNKVYSHHIRKGLYVNNMDTILGFFHESRDPNHFQKNANIPRIKIYNFCVLIYKYFGGWYYQLDTLIFHEKQMTFQNTLYSLKVNKVFCDFHYTPFLRPNLFKNL